jgi:hypothetical protein
VALTVIGSTPIIHPKIFWYNIYKNLKINKNKKLLINKNIDYYISKNLIINRFKKINFFLKNYLFINKLIKELRLYTNYKRYNIINLYANYYILKTHNLVKFNYKKFVIIIINILKKKIFITLIKNNKLILNLSPGIITKKLEINNKNAKKNLKIINLMIKTIINNFKKLYKSEYYFIQIKGAKNNIYTILNLLKIRVNLKKTYFIFSPFINYNNYKFKKIRSIKRKLRKKFIKL